MALINPRDNNRIGIVCTTSGGESVPISSIINAVELMEDSPFWVFHFGKKIPIGEGQFLDDRGSVILEEATIRNILKHIDSGLKGEE